VLSRQRSREGRYANYFEVGHNAAEFVIDFGQCHDDQGPGRPLTRLVTSPLCAKLLTTMLNRAVERYESDHGAIESGEDSVDPLEVVLQSIEGYDHALRSLTRKRGAPS